MSKPTHKTALAQFRRNVPLFAALGDHTRAQLVVKLGDGAELSITQLTAGTRLTRQAVTKHLRVLQGAGVVQAIRRGREQRFQLEPQSLKQASDSLALVSAQWDDALARLKTFVEE